LLGFEVTVIEQRTAVITMKENTLASHKQIMPYTEIANAIINGMLSIRVCDDP